MKNYAKGICAALMCVLLFAACAKPTQTAQPTAGQNTATATQGPSATPTAAPDVEGKMIWDFNGTDIPVTQEDLSAYGVAAAGLSLQEENADAGSALRIALDGDAARYCQSLVAQTSIDVAGIFAKAGEYTWLRMWIYNTAATDIAIVPTLAGSGTAGHMSPEGVRLTQADGEEVDFSVSNATGAGENSVVVPAGFAGWVAWPLSEEVVPVWDSKVPLITEVTSFKLDSRPSAAGAGDYYLIDEVGLFKTPAGALREYTPPKAADLEAIKEGLETALTAQLGVTPRVVPVKEYNPTVAEWSNISAITYDGAKIGENKTKVFAYLGYPKNMEAGKKYPAVVLAHGGGGHAFAEWVKLWTDRGYVAIAMDTTGFFPSEAGKGVAGRESDYNKDYWKYGLYGSFSEEGYVNAPNNDNMGTSRQPYERQWMYHALSSVILAHNILRADEKVDSAKIGLTGISWGGIMAALAIGYDTRWAFAVPVYGSAFLEESLGWQKPIFSEAATNAVWSAADRLSKVKFPVLWQGWTLDEPFSYNSNSQSYLALPGSMLSMRMNMGHSHSAAWNSPEAYLYADAVLAGQAAGASFKTEPGKSRSINVSIGIPAGSTVTAKAYYITEAMSYKDSKIQQKFTAVNLTVNGTSVTGTLPENAHTFYIELTTKKGSTVFISTGSLVSIP